MAKKKAAKKKHEKHASKNTQNKSLLSIFKEKIEFLENNPRYVLIGIVVFAIIQGIFLFDFKLNLTGDNISFIDLGKSVARGDGLGTSAKYPYIFPILLAIVQILFNESVKAQKILVFLLFQGTVPFIFLIFKRYVGVFWSLVISLAVLSSSHLIEYSHYIMSEIPYLFFSFLALYLIIKSDEKDSVKDNKWLWFAVLGTGAAYYTRTAGLALVAALVGFYIVRKSWKKALFSAVGSVVVLLPWSIRNSMMPEGNTYLRDLFNVNPYQPELGRLNFEQLVQRITDNLHIYFTHMNNGNYGNVIPKIVLPIHFESSFINAATFNLFVSLLLCCLVFGGLVYSFIKHKDILGIYLVFYMGMLILYPQVWSGSRFVIPVIPIFIYFIFYILIVLYRLSAQYKSNFVPAFLLGLSLLFLFSVHTRNIVRYNGYMAKFPAEWQNYFDAGEWAKKNVDKDAMFTCRKPGLFSTVSEHGCCNFVKDPDFSKIMQGFYDNKVDYVVIAGIPYGDIGRYLVPTYRKYTEYFQIAHVSGDPNSGRATYLFKFLRDKPFPPEPAGDKKQ